MAGWTFATVFGEQTAVLALVRAQAARARSPAEYTRGRGILHARLGSNGRRPCPQGETVTLLPWEYFWIGFNKDNFPDLFDAIWVSSLVLLVVLIVLYAVRTRALHRHRLYLDMWEWIFWTGLITFFLLVVGSIFQFDFAVILVILATGLSVLAYASFRR